MKSQPLLSIIMPCYNVADTFRRAIDSVLMQEVNFPYEVILVNDASTDETPEFFAMYAKNYDFIKVINNRENSGNALSFYNGLCQAQGKYFCVLDGDDYYSVIDKLQRQVDFLEADVKEEYVATCHYYVYSVGERVFVPKVYNISEFNYIDWVTRNAGYYHTTTYMYRNIFKGNVPAYYKDQIFRGDSPRTIFHLMFSNKKVKVMNFVGSVYVYTYKGIWSGLDEAKQNKRHVDLYSRLTEISNTDFEKNAFTKIKDEWESKGESGQGEYQYFSAYTIDEYIAKIQPLTKTYAFKSGGIAFKSFYYSSYLDSLLETFGYIHQALHPEHVQKTVREKTIALVAGKLIATGGGIFTEIKELIGLYPDYKVEILLTDATSAGEEELKQLNSRNNVQIHCLPENCADKMGYIFGKFVEISPEKAYFYTAHDNPYAITLMRKGICKNVCIFSFDHGYVCGISNPNLDCIIAKRPTDYQMLKKYFPNRVVYIPTWGSHKTRQQQERYQPFFQHDKLITACAAARFYKVDGSSEQSYLDMIVDLLAKTGGKHYHFGPIPDEQKAVIEAKLREKGVPTEAFVHIPWAPNLADAMIENRVDVFIEPFPVNSYKITLEIESVGVPILSYDGLTRITKVDFIYEGNLVWQTKEDFVQTLLNLDRDTLLMHSKKSVQYFNENHDIEVIAPYFVSEREVCVPRNVSFADDVIHEVTEYSRAYNLSPQINFSFGGKAPTPVAKATAPAAKTTTAAAKSAVDYTPPEAMILPEEQPQSKVKKFFKVWKEDGVRKALKKALKKIRQKLLRKK